MYVYGACGQLIDSKFLKLNGQITPLFTADVFVLTRRPRQYVGRSRSYLTHVPLFKGFDAFMFKVDEAAEHQLLRRYASSLSTESSLHIIELCVCKWLTYVHRVRSTLRRVSKFHSRSSHDSHLHTTATRKFQSNGSMSLTETGHSCTYHTLYIPIQLILSPTQCRRPQSAANSTQPPK